MTKLGFLKSNKCPKSYSTEISLEFHSIYQRKKESDIMFLEIACPVCNLYFGSKIDLQLHRSNAHEEIWSQTPNECDNESSIGLNVATASPL